jgi:transcriptional regulator with XRE-family HTH domain
MPIKAHLKPGDGQRRDSRRVLRLETEGRLPDGPEANVTVHNISAVGLLVESRLAIEPGERLEIDLPEVGTVAAIVVWRSEAIYGCAFETALNSAALAATQLRASAAPTAGTAAIPSPAGVSDPFGSAFGSKLNRLRRERGLTLANVASALGVSKPTVWAWEKGKARPLPDRLDAIAAALGVSREELDDVGHMGLEADALIAECRAKIAAALSVGPAAVRIMIEL